MRLKSTTPMTIKTRTLFNYRNGSAAQTAGYSDTTTSTITILTTGGFGAGSANWRSGKR